MPGRRLHDIVRGHFASTPSTMVLDGRVRQSQQGKELSRTSVDFLNWKGDRMFDVNQRRPVLLAATITLAAQILAAVPACARQAVDPSNVTNTNIDLAVERAVAPFIADSCHVGLSMAIVDGDTRRFYNYGTAVRGQNVAPTPDSVYEVASVTKTFTGVLAAQAVLEGRIKLDADFRQYLPEHYSNLTWQGQPITLRTLATHRSGLPRDLPDTDDLYAHSDSEQLPARVIARDTPYTRSRYLRELHRMQFPQISATRVRSIACDHSSWQLFGVRMSIQIVRIRQVPRQARAMGGERAKRD